MNQPQCYLVTFPVLAVLGTITLVTGALMTVSDALSSDVPIKVQYESGRIVKAHLYSRRASRLIVRENDMFKLECFPLTEEQKSNVHFAQINKTCTLIKVNNSKNAYANEPISVDLDMNDNLIDNAVIVSHEN